MGLCFRSVEAEITKGKGEDSAEASSLLPLLLRGAEDETRMKTCPPHPPGDSHSGYLAGNGKECLRAGSHPEVMGCVMLPQGLSQPLSSTWE